MSAMVLWRMPNMVVIATDGGNYRSFSDFTLTGKCSKQMLYPHAPIAVVCCGASALPAMVAFNWSQHWTSFDAALDVLQDNCTQEMRRWRRLFRHREYLGIFGIAGYSDKRERFETYTINCGDETGFGDADPPEPCPEFSFFPQPGGEQLEKYFGHASNISLNGSDYKNEIVRFMTAQRNTPYEMVDAHTEECAGHGHTVGAFVQITTMFKDSMYTEIVHRWPDELDQMVDPSKDPPLPERVPIAETAP